MSFTTLRISKNVLASATSPLSRQCSPSASLLPSARLRCEKETTADSFGCFFRAFESKLLVVVAKIKANECWIITGYWEERA